MRTGILTNALTNSIVRLYKFTGAITFWNPVEDEMVFRVWVDIKMPRDTHPREVIEKLGNELNTLTGRLDLDLERFHERDK